MDFLIGTAAAAATAPSAAAAPVALPARTINPADVAAYIDPHDIVAP